MSRIIALPSLKVKPARKTPRPHAPFGQGIFPYRPFAGRMPFTQADLDFAARLFGEHATDYDLAAGESLSQSRIDRGIIF